MSFSPATFRPVRRSLLSLLPCLLIVLSVLVSNTPTHATTQSTDGAVDLGFKPAILYRGMVNALARQPDGKILIVGAIHNIDGVNRNNIARFNDDGSLDPTFDLDTGVDGYVNKLALQPDGKVLIGGSFTTGNGVFRDLIARLNTDGSLDPTFDPDTDVDGYVHELALQPDGKVLVAGYFTSVDGVRRNGVVRLNTDGSRDPAFVDGSMDEYYWLYALLPQPDGKLLIAGSFITDNGWSRGVVRLNADGSRDPAFHLSLGEDDRLRSLALQPDGKLLVGSITTTINGVSRTHVARFNADGSLDPTFNSTTGPDRSVTNIALQADGKIIIEGNFWGSDGVVSQNRIARLNADGSVDPSFHPGIGANDWIDALALQPDGKVIIGGAFTSVDGMHRSHIARFNADGSLDPAFNPNMGEHTFVPALALQPDGKVLIGGGFTSIDRVSRNGIARLNADGSLDPAFDPGVGANNSVSTLVLQPDGKIVIGGYFTTVNGVSRTHVARLNADGSLDPAFDPGMDEDVYPTTLALQPDGKVVIGGYDFPEGSDTNHGRITRLNADGSLDSTFHPSMGQEMGKTDVALQPDGKMIIGGGFTSINGVSRDRIARLNTDGSLDPAFDPGIDPNRSVENLALQPDGKVVIAGSSSSDGGRSFQVRLERLNPDGSLDRTFNPGIVSDGWVTALALQPDGKIIIAGTFSGTDGVFRNGIVRLNADGSLDPAFNVSTGTYGWVSDLALQPDGKVVIGGFFSSIGGVNRSGVARLHPTTAAPRLFLSPDRTTTYPGQTFQLDLNIDTAGRVADTIDAYLSYDPAVLEVVDAAGNPATSITENPAVVDSVTYNHVDRATGQIGFSASRSTSPYLTGSATVATIRFRAKAPTTSTSVQLVRSGARQSDLFAGGADLLVALSHATIEVAPGVRVCGRIAVEQRGPAGTARWITPLFRTEGTTTTAGVTLYQPGTSTEVGRFAVTTDTDGRFCGTATGVPAGIYDVRVKGANTLSNQRANVDLRTAAEINFGTLRVGDSTGNDAISGADVSYMIPSFFLRSGDAGFRPYADTNRDDEITGADVSALIPNFLQTGPQVVTGAVVAQPAPIRAAGATTPRIALTPALTTIRVGEIAAIDLRLHLDSLTADTVDLQLQIDPTLLEIVDRTGQPITKLDVDRTAFPDVSYNAVDATTGTMRLSASRVRAGAATGSLTIATLYVRAKQPFTTAPILLTTTGRGRTDVFAQGQSLQPTATGSILTMGNLSRTYLPRASE